MAKVVIELDSAGMNEFLHSEDIVGICKDIADSAAAKLGPGYETDTWMGTSRGIASVKAVTEEAVRDNEENNTIIKALGAIK